MTAYEMRISDWSSDVGSSDLSSFVLDAGTGSDFEPGHHQATRQSRQSKRKLEFHFPTVEIVECPQQGFRHHRRLRFGAMPAHFENLHRVRAALDDGLHEREHFAVLEAHEPRGTAHIARLRTECREKG